MIFGLTRDEQWRRHILAEEKRLAAQQLGKIKFAFTPVELDDGRYVWLGYYMRKLEVKYSTYKPHDEEERVHKQEIWHNLPMPE